MHKHAIVRIPGRNFGDGLTTAGLGVPQHERALQQHARYREALQECGLAITTLDAELRYPDATFVEDTAVLTAQSAVISHPGARSREGEIEAIRQVLAGFYPVLEEIHAPGTLDGGDVCQAGDHFFIGISARTNEEGAEQLARQLARDGYYSSFVDVRGIDGLLHLKTGVSYLGDDTFIGTEAMARQTAFAGRKFIRLLAEEASAANCLRVNHRVLVPAGNPRSVSQLLEHGFDPLVLDISEFQKMDGGLSCLSLRL